MLGSITGAHSSALSAGALSGVNSGATGGFEEQLYAAIANSLARLGSSGSKIEVNVQETTSQLPGAAPGFRQYVITVNPLAAPATASPGPAAASLWKPAATKDTPGIERLPAIASNKLSVREIEDPLPALKEELRKIGVDPVGLQFDVIDEVVQNLGGDYVNHYIRTRFPNGRTEDFSVEWTLVNPKVTAVEIQRNLRLA